MSARLTEQNGKKVVFRRIRGRLVPIKIDAKSAGAFKAARTRKSNATKAKRDLAKGAGLIGGGIGLASLAQGLSGLILGTGAKRSAKRISTVRGLTKGAPSISTLQRAGKLTFGSKGFTSTLMKSAKLGSIAKVGGFVLGEALVGKGIGKVTESLSGEKQGIAGDVISHVVGSGVTVLGALALRKGIKVGLGKKSIFKLNKATKLEFK